MADEKEFVLTREGKLELENELDTLKNITRKEVSEKIKEARSFGDLSENAEYDEAKNEQAEVEARINEIEYMLKYARVIDDEEIKSDVVTPGSKVVLAIFGGEEKYTIVGSTEADPYKNKLSYESPIGAACLNRAAGETVKANTPGGEIEFKIMGKLIKRSDFFEFSHFKRRLLQAVRNIRQISSLHLIRCIMHTSRTYRYTHSTVVMLYIINAS